MKCCECFVCGQEEPTEPTRGLTVLWNCLDSDVCFSTVGSSHATPVHSGATGHLSLCGCLMSPARESPAGQIDMTHLGFYTGGRALGSSVRNSSTGMSRGHAWDKVSVTAPASRRDGGRMMLRIQLKPVLVHPSPCHSGVGSHSRVLY